MSCMVMGSHIEEKIIAAILSRLPVKSILRFMCVSGFWKTLISEPSFKKKHLNHAKNQPNSQKMLSSLRFPQDTALYFYSSSLYSLHLVEDIRRFDLPYNSKPLLGIKVYSCCDGLFLIGIWTPPRQEEASTLLIWNPSTGESIVLPPLELMPPEETTYESIFGLGYDSTSDGYKVLRIDMSGDDISNEILALKSGSWRKIDKASTRTCLLSHSDCLAFVHGSFHWFGMLLSRYMVVSFNISDEIYGEIPLPLMMYLLPLNTTMNIEVNVGVSVLGGMLCTYHNNKIAFNLWVMKDYGDKESWMKSFTIPSYGVHLIIPIYRFSDNAVLLSDEDTTRIVCRIISSGYDAFTIRRVGYLYTESLIAPKLGH